ncbi:hypothetical protein KFE25_007231 [Diacronema lutheri]|uniref:Uncharacterized protein n=1 Tax=Diacronema lutheri TaxID=2081491 RepID=A0A8J5X543_DIALT|nr:hypothetical protein KFE25_007231 [Diacronema lutheri]
MSALGDARSEPAPLETTELFHFETRTASGEVCRIARYEELGSAEEAAHKLELRRALARSPLVVSAAMRFWETANLGEAERIDREAYVGLYARISRALGVTSRDDVRGRARELALQDWEHDLAEWSGGGGDDGGAGMPRSAFCASLFELADTWTLGVSESEYAAFLNKLFRRITRAADARLVPQQVVALLRADAPTDAAQLALQLVATSAEQPRTLAALDDVQSDADVAAAAAAWQRRRRAAAPPHDRAPAAPSRGAADGRASTPAAADALDPADALAARERVARAAALRARYFSATSAAATVAPAARPPPASARAVAGASAARAADAAGAIGEARAAAPRESEQAGAAIAVVVSRATAASTRLRPVESAAASIGDWAKGAHDELRVAIGSLLALLGGAQALVQRRPDATDAANADDGADATARPSTRARRVGRASLPANASVGMGVSTRARAHGSRDGILRPPRNKRHSISRLAHAAGSELAMTEAAAAATATAGAAAATTNANANANATATANADEFATHGACTAELAELLALAAEDAATAASAEFAEGIDTLVERLAHEALGAALAAASERAAGVAAARDTRAAAGPSMAAAVSPLQWQQPPSCGGATAAGPSSMAAAVSPLQWQQPPSCGGATAAGPRAADNDGGGRLRVERAAALDSVCDAVDLAARVGVYAPVAARLHADNERWRRRARQQRTGQDGQRTGQDGQRTGQDGQNGRDGRAHARTARALATPAAVVTATAKARDEAARGAPPARAARAADDADVRATEPPPVAGVELAACALNATVAKGAAAPAAPAAAAAAAAAAAGAAAGAARGAPRGVGPCAAGDGDEHAAAVSNSALSLAMARDPGAARRAGRGAEPGGNGAGVGVERGAARRAAAMSGLGDEGDEGDEGNEGRREWRERTPSLGGRAAARAGAAAAADTAPPPSPPSHAAEPELAPAPIVEVPLGPPRTFKEARARLALAAALGREDALGALPALGALEREHAHHRQRRAAHMARGARRATWDGPTFADGATHPPAYSGVAVGM